MAVTVADLIAKLRLDFEQFRTGAQQAGQESDKLAQRIGGASSFSNRLSDSLKQAAKSVAITSASIAAATFAVSRFTDALIENAKEVRNISALSGLSAEAADNLTDTFQLLGFDTGSLGLAIFRLGQQMDEGSDSLQRFGISFRDATGRIKPEGEIFLELRDRISGMGTASERSAALMEVFGRAGRSLAPIFALSREEFKRFMDEASGLSPWSQEAQENALKLAQSINRLAQSWRAVKEAIALSIAEPIGRFFDSMAEGMKKIREGFSPKELLAAAEKELAGLDFVSRMFGHEEGLRRRIELLRELVRETERARSATGRGAEPPPPFQLPPHLVSPSRFEESPAARGLRGAEEPFLPAEVPLIVAEATERLRELQVELDALNTVMASPQPQSYSDRLREITESGRLMSEETQTVSAELDAQVKALLAADNQLKRNRVTSEALGRSFDRLEADLRANREAFDKLVAGGVAPTSKEFVILQERIKSLQATIELRSMFEEAFGAIRRGISETVIGVLRGTQTMEEAFRSAGQNIALSLLESIVNRALKQIQEAIWRVIEDMIAMQSFSGGGGGFLGSIIGSIGGLVGGFFGGPAGGGAGGGGLGQTPQFAQHGGLVTQPTLTMMGERGPEAIIPLERFREFMPTGLEGGADFSGLASELALLRQSVEGLRLSLGATGPARELVKMQEGGLVSMPTPIMAGERGTEAIVPLHRMGEMSQRFDEGGRGGGPMVQQIINMQPGLPETVRAVVWQMLPEIIRHTEAAVLRASERGGSMSRVMGRRAR